VPFQRGAEAMARVRATTFSESHLGCTSGTRETLPLVEAYVRESLGLVT